MTKEEFIQRAAISMAGKVIGASGTTDAGDWDNVLTEAVELAEVLEENGWL